MFYVILLFIMSIKCLNVYKGVRTILLSDFKKTLNSGFGNAIIELKESKDEKHDYKDAVLYASLHNTCYDPYCEEERYDYLFEAIKYTNDMDFFENKIIEKLFKNNFFFTVQQLSGLLYLFGKNGSEKSIDALRDRFDEYLTILPKKRNYISTENPIKCAEIIAVRLCELYGLEYFLKYIECIEGILVDSPENNLQSYDIILNFSYEKFGEKKLLNTLKKRSKKSDRIRCFLDKISIDEISEEETKQNKPLKKVTYKTLINSAEKEDDDYLLPLAIQASKSAKDIEILQAADRLKSEKNAKFIHALLLFFIFVDYPYDINDIITKYETSEDYAFRAACLRSLYRYKDKRLHDLAIYNLRNKIMVKESLGLLIKNFNDDYSYILEALEEHKDNQNYDFHALVLQVIKIFQNRKCKKAADILAYAYNKNRCSYCRSSLVEIMCNNNIIPNEIFQECLYDCSNETKMLVNNYN